MNDFWHKFVDHYFLPYRTPQWLLMFLEKTPVFTLTFKALNDLVLRSSPASSHTPSPSTPPNPHHTNLLSVPWPCTACVHFRVLTLTVPSARNALSSPLGMDGSTLSFRSGLTYHLLTRLKWWCAITTGLTTLFPFLHSTFHREISCTLFVYWFIIHLSDWNAKFLRLDPLHT